MNIIKTMIIIIIITVIFIIIIITDTINVIVVIIILIITVTKCFSIIYFVVYITNVIMANNMCIQFFIR
jgi:hypothetical protein